jgi:hypothetical protein
MKVPLLCVRCGGQYLCRKEPHEEGGEKEQQRSAQLVHVDRLQHRKRHYEVGHQVRQESGQIDSLAVEGFA